MKAGFGEVVVTPPLGTGMAGYFTARRAEGILDDLYSRALVVSEGDVHVALVVTDLIYVPDADVAAMKERVTAATGIPGDHILLAATHTHTGPITVAKPGFHRDDEAMTTWVRLTAGAVEMAFRRRTEVKVAAGRGSLPGVAFNRRYRMKNGRVFTNPGLGNPDIIEAAGPVDPEVVVLRFDDLEGRPVGILTSFSCHCDTVGGSMFSADWVGVAAATLRRIFAGMPLGKTEAQSRGPGGIQLPPDGGGVNQLGVVVVNTASGDINHFNVFSGKPGWPGATYQIGVGLAAETARVAVTLKPEPCSALGAAARRITLQRIPLEQFVAESKAALADPRTGRMEARRAEANLSYASFYAEEPPQAEAEVICLRIGPVLISGCPGEMSCELGLAFKKEVPAPYAFMANLANGYHGYIPAARAYEEGGYENRSARYVPGTGELMVTTAVELAKELWNE